MPSLEPDVSRRRRRPDLTKYFHHCPSGAFVNGRERLFDLREVLGVREPLGFAYQRRLVVEVVIDDALRDPDFCCNFSCCRIEARSGEAAHGSA